MSRQSLAALSVVQPLELVERPGPPSELTAEQSQEWLAVINRLPADWFPRETHPLLAQYCRHVVAARRIAQLIEQTEASDEMDISAYDKLLTMQTREARSIAMLATKMRIAQQSTYDEQKRTGRKISTAKPWGDSRRQKHSVD